jgi:hypothetical protein
MARLGRYFPPDQPLKKSTLTPIPLDVAADVLPIGRKKGGSGGETGAA